MGSGCSRRQLQRDQLKPDFKELVKSTPFKLQQLKQWHDEFLKDCPDGAMSKAIFVANYRDVFCAHHKSLNIEKLTDFIFDKFDVNHDGVISFDEFVKAIAIPISGSVDEKLHWAFTIYDVDSDGYVSKEEMLKIVDAICAKRPADERGQARARVERIFAAMDANQDGRLSEKEFVDGFKKDPQILRTLLAKDGDADDDAIAADEAEVTITIN